jgi:hypothetical protein
MDFALRGINIKTYCTWCSACAFKKGGGNIKKRKKKKRKTIAGPGPVEQQVVAEETRF